MEWDLVFVGLKLCSNVVQCDQVPMTSHQNSDPIGSRAQHTREHIRSIFLFYSRHKRRTRCSSSISFQYRPLSHPGTLERAWEIKEKHVKGSKMKSESWFKIRDGLYSPSSNSSPSIDERTARNSNRWSQNGTICSMTIVHVLIRFKYLFLVIELFDGRVVNIECHGFSSVCVVRTHICGKWRNACLKSEDSNRRIFVMDVIAMRK